MLNNVTTRAYVLVASYLMTLKREEGQGMAEYGLIIALVAIVLAISLTALQTGIAGVFTDIVDAFTP